MENKYRYVLWGFGLCMLLTVFACAMILIGIKPLSMGQLMTTLCLTIADVVLFVVYWRGTHSRK